MPNYTNFVFCSNCLVWVWRKNLRPNQLRCDKCGLQFRTKPHSMRFKEKYNSEATRY